MKANDPSPLLSATNTPASPKPTMSALPSPVMSARKRGCFSTRQPPASKPRSASTNCGAWNDAVAVAQRRPHAGIAEADDVGLAVAGDVGQEARVLVHPPAACFEAEVCQHELRRLERAVAVAERRPHAGVAEADDVGLAVAGDVGQEARVLVDAPAACFEARSLPARTAAPGTCRRRCSAPSTRRHRRSRRCRPRPSPVMSARKRGCLSTRQPPASKPKSASTNCGAWKVPSPLLSAVHTPASPKPTMSALPSPVMSARKRGCLSTRQPRLEAEVGQHELRIGEESVALAERRPHAGVAEARRCRPAVTGDVGEEARDAGRRSHPPGVSQSRALLDSAEVTGAKEDGEVVDERRGRIVPA